MPLSTREIGIGVRHVIVIHEPTFHQYVALRGVEEEILSLGGDPDLGAGVVQL